MPIQRPNYEFPLQPGLFEMPESEINTQVVRPEEARLRSETARTALGNLAELPTWYEEYLNLVDGGWPWRVAAYIAWAASPRAGRWPSTQEKLATEVLGLTSDRQIIKWREKNDEIMNMITALQVAPMLKHRADVIDALIQSAKDPDYKSHQDRKLFLEITGDYIPSAKLDAILSRSAGVGEEGMSTEELRKQAGKDANFQG